MDNRLIGPVLPPHLVSKVLSSEEDEEKIDLRINDTDSTLADPCSSSAVPSEANTQHTECDTYGPALPPHLRKRTELPLQSQTVGPSLPSENLIDAHKAHAQNDSYDEDSSDDIVGPPVPGVNAGSSELSLTQQKLEMRAQYLKKKMAEESSNDGKKDVAERESWMLELPPERANNLGLGPRSFRKREAPDLKDRSDWTDTPADRKRKLLGIDSDSSKDDKEEMMKAAAIMERDKVMEKMAESCKDEKRQLSLLEMHQKKRLKKEKKEKKKRGDKPPERRPFDRNIDLQANRFDEAQKKSIFKKAQLLDTRFSCGQSKFL